MAWQRPDEPFKHTDFTNPFKITPISCVQDAFPIASSVLQGHILFKSRDKNDTTEKFILIDEAKIIGKSDYLDALIQEYKKCPGKLIVLSDVNLKLLKDFCENPDALELSFPVQATLLEIGFKLEITSMYTSAAQFFNKTPIPLACQVPETLSKIMRAIRYRVSADAQGHCLDQILKHPEESFPKAGAFIKQAFALQKDGNFDHDLQMPAQNNNYEELKLICCDHPRPFIKNHTKPVMQCSICRFILCTRCQRNRCPPRVMSYIQGTFYIRVEKTKCKKAKMSRAAYEAIGPIFPHADFSTLEDTFLLDGF